MNAPSDKTPHTSRLVALHLLVGWGCLIAFVLLGVALEFMHAYKLGAYLDAHQETRRLLFRLAHAHGALLALLHVALAFTFSYLSDKTDETDLRFVSGASIGALALIPFGFLGAGFFAVDGDSGPAIVAVPIGAVLLLLALGRLILALFRTRS